MMNEEIMKKLKRMTAEEKDILRGNREVKKGLYTRLDSGFVVDCRHMLAEQSIIGARAHTRFVHFPEHRHNYIEMIYMCSGTTTHIINKKHTIRLKEGDILFLNQNALQEILPAGEDDIAVNFLVLPVFFDQVFPILKSKSLVHDFIVGSLKGKGRNVDYLQFKTQNNRQIQNLAENLIMSLFDQKKTSDYINQMTMGLLIMNLEEHCRCINFNGRARSEESTINEIMDYIEKNYNTVTLQTLSGMINEPCYTVSRLIKKHTGYHFKEILKRNRIQQAKKLILSTNLPIEKIIILAGYNNTSYFYHIFREECGMSPREYRLWHRRTQRETNGTKEDC